MCFRRVYRVNEKIENKHLKKTCSLYSQVYPSTKLVVWVLLKGNLKLIPLNTSIYPLSEDCKKKIL